MDPVLDQSVKIEVSGCSKTQYCRERQLMTATPCFDDTSNGKTIREKRFLFKHWHGKLSGNVFLRSLHQVPRKKGLVRNKYKDFQQKQTSGK